MGNCLGKPGIDSHGIKKSGASPASRSVFNKDCLQLQLDSSLGAGASSAHFAASPAQNTYSSIYKCSQDTILIGLVEGVESLEASSALTAAFVSKHLLQTFQETCQRCGGLDQNNHQDILRTTLQSLHRQCLASPKLPRVGGKNSNTGAVAATLALVNLATHTCSVANVGHSRCLIAGVSGSFNSKRPHCTWATTLHSTENQKEKIHSDRHKSTSTLIPLSTRKKEGKTCVSNPVYLTRALGIVNNSSTGSTTDNLGAKRSFTSAIFKDKYDVQVDVNTFHLTPTEGHLIIGSSGFWEVVSAPAVALRAHLFSKFQEAQKSVVEAALNDGVPLPSPAERATFLAEHLINFALGTAADRLEASFQKDAPQGAATTHNSNKAQSINAEDLKMLPFELDIPTDSVESSVMTEDRASDGDERDADNTANNEEQGKEKLVRKDLFGDLACVAISLQWPHQGHQAMFQPPAPRLFHPTTAKMSSSIGNTRGRRAVLHMPAFQNNNNNNNQNSGSDIAPLARYRWLQLRMVVDYHRLHRREMLQRWQESVHGILKKAQQRAKAVAYQVENEFSIAVNVSPLMKLSAKDGQSLPSSAFNVRASINF